MTKLRAAGRGKQLPVGPGDDAPIACTLDHDAVPERLQEWERVLSTVAARSRIPGGVRLSLGAHTSVAEVATLATAEHACCAFFAFALTIDSRGVGLEVTGPLEAQPLITELFGSPSA